MWRAFLTTVVLLAVAMAQVPEYAPGVIPTGAASDVTISGTGVSEGTDVRLTSLERPVPNMAVHPWSPEPVGTSLGNGGYRPAVCDVDDDGNLDMIMTASYPPRIAWVRGHGDGTFDAAVTLISLDAATYDIACGDVSGDGVDDVVVQTGDVTVFVNANTVVGGVPTFDAGTVVASPGGTGGQAHRVTVVDVDKSGTQDIVMVANWQLFWLSNDGAGTYTREELSEAHPGGTGKRGGEFVVVDMDGDTNPDIVWINESDDEVLIATQAPLGTFTSVVKFTDDPASFSGLTVADFDGVNGLDIVTTQTSDSRNVRYWRNDGTNEFVEQTAITTNRYSFEVASLDTNSDGHPDVISPSPSDSTVQVFLGDGTSFSTGTPVTWKSATRLVVADFNGDNNDDFVVSSNIGEARVMISDGAGSFSLGIEAASDGGARSTSVVDVDGDGDLDIVICGALEKIGWYRNVDNSGTWGDFEVFVDDLTDQCYEIVTEDLNGDGLWDIAVSAGSRVYLYMQDEDGAFTRSAHELVVGTGYQMEAADVNEDGHMDLAVASSSGTAGYWLNDGTGTFTKFSLGTVASNSQGMILADMDGNGWLDMVVGSNSAFRIFLYDGDTESFTTVSSDTPGLGMAAFDADGDGDMDLLLSDGNGALIRLGTSDGAATPSFTFEVMMAAYNPRIMKTADINHDGHTDVVVLTTQSREVFWLAGDGAGNFVPNTMYQKKDMPGNTMAMLFDYQLVDMDGDGDLDVVYADTQSHYVFVAYNPNTAGVTSTAQGKTQLTKAIEGTQTNFYTAVGDLNGDGHTDVVAFRTHSSLRDIVFFEGDAAGNLAEGVTLMALGASYSYTFMHDIDGDTNMDLLVMTSNGAEWFKNDGSLSFTSQGLVTGDDTSMLHFADVNGDTHEDIVWSGNNGFYVGLGDGTGNFVETRTILGNKPGALMADDHSFYSANYFLDTVYRWTSNGDGTYASSLVGSVDNPYYVVAGDVNDDGTDDAVIGTEYGVYWLNRADNAINWLCGTGTTFYGHVADLDADGDDDVIYMEGGLVHMCEQVSPGVFEELVLHQGDANVKIVNVADTNADGHLDVVVGSNSIRIYLGQGPPASVDVSVGAGGVTSVTLPQAAEYATQARNGADAFADAPNSLFGVQGGSDCPIGSYVWTNEGRAACKPCAGSTSSRSVNSLVCDTYILTSLDGLEGAEAGDAPAVTAVGVPFTAGTKVIFSSSGTCAGDLSGEPELDLTTPGATVSPVLGSGSYVTCYDDGVSVAQQQQILPFITCLGDQDGVCLVGETCVTDCDGVCAAADDDASTDCDGACDAGEDGSSDCDGACDVGDALAGPDCDGDCHIGDIAGSVDCDGTKNGDDEFGSVDWDCNELADCAAPGEFCGGERCETDANNDGACDALGGTDVCQASYWCNGVSGECETNPGACTPTGGECDEFADLYCDGTQCVADNGQDGCEATDDCAAGFVCDAGGACVDPNTQACAGVANNAVCDGAFVHDDVYCDGAVCQLDPEDDGCNAADGSCATGYNCLAATRECVDPTVVPCDRLNGFFNEGECGAFIDRAYCGGAVCHKDEGSTGCNNGAGELCDTNFHCAGTGCYFAMEVRFVGFGSVSPSRLLPDHEHHVELVGLAGGFVVGTAQFAFVNEGADCTVPGNHMAAGDYPIVDSALDVSFSATGTYDTCFSYDDGVTWTKQPTIQVTVVEGDDLIDDNDVRGTLSGRASAISLNNAYADEHTRVAFIVQTVGDCMEADDREGVTTYSSDPTAITPITVDEVTLFDICYSEDAGNTFERQTLSNIDLRVSPVGWASVIVEDGAYDADTFRQALAGVLTDIRTWREEIIITSETAEGDRYTLELDLPDFAAEELIGLINTADQSLVDINIVAGLEVAGADPVQVDYDVPVTTQWDGTTEEKISVGGTIKGEVVFADVGGGVDAVNIEVSALGDAQFDQGNTQNPDPAVTGQGFGITGNFLGVSYRVSVARQSDGHTLSFLQRAQRHLFNVGAGRSDVKLMYYDSVVNVWRDASQSCVTNPIAPVYEEYDSITGDYEVDVCHNTQFALYENQVIAEGSGDPHFEGFHGGWYDFMGEAGKVFNIFSDVSFAVNARFVSFDFAPGATYMGEIGVLAGTHRLSFDAQGVARIPDASVCVPLDAANPRKCALVGGGYVSWNDDSMTVTYGAYRVTVRMEGWQFEGGVADALAYELSIDDSALPADWAPHGVHGQTANTQRVVVGAGKQGEGVVQGVWTDYEVAGGELFGTEWAFNRFAESHAAVETASEEAFDTAPRSARAQ